METAIKLLLTIAIMFIISIFIPPGAPMFIIAGIMLCKGIWNGR